MSDKVIVLHPVITLPPSERTQIQRKPESALHEAIGLARAINLTIQHAEIIRLNKITPATLMGSGNVERIADIVKETEATLAFVDHALSPVQQRNLEKAWNC